MKVILIDILSPAGHVNYNKGLIRIISNGGNEVTLCSQRDMVERACDNMKVDKIIMPDTLFLDHACDLPNNAFRPLVWRKRLISWLSKYVSIFNEYDFVLFTSSEPLSLSFISRKLTAKNGFVDHGVGKIEDSLFYRFCYKYLLSNRTNIIVLEEYIGEYVESKIRRRTKILYHPIFYTNVEPSTQVNSSNILFAPSGGNDRCFINQLIADDNNIPDGTKIIIKSSDISYKSERLTVYCNRLSSEDYYQYMSEARAILIPYEPSYNYRTSAIFFEAMANKKPVFILNNNTLVRLSQKYPKVSFLIKSVADIKNAIQESSNIDDVFYSEVLQHYSDDNILLQFYSL